MEQSRTRFAFQLAVFYASIAILYLVLPVADRFGSVLIGSRLLSKDSLLGAGILEWGFRSLYSPGLHFFDWNAGFPIQNSLAVTENLVGWQIFYSPLRWSGLGVAASYNAVLLLSLVISGVGAALFALRMGSDRWGSAIAGFIFALGPFHLANLMNIQTMAVCWVPFAFLFLDRFLSDSRFDDALGLAAAFILTVLSGIYVGVFLALMMLVYVVASWTLKRYSFRREIVSRLGLVLLVGVAGVTPVAYHYVQFIGAHGVAHESAANIASLSMDWASPLRTPEFQIAWSKTRLMTPLWNAEPAFIGISAVVLVFLCLATARRGGIQRKTIALLVFIAVVAYLLALGPYLKTVGPGPSEIIFSVPMPGRIWLAIPGIRWPSRIFFFAWLAAATIAGLGVTSLRKVLRPHSARAVGPFVLMALVLEYAPARWLAAESVNVSAPIDESDSYRFLASEHDIGGVAELPLTTSSDHRQDLVERYIYGASGHLRRIVGFHGSRTIPLTDSLELAVLRLPDDSAAGILVRGGVTRLVVHKMIPGESTASVRLIDSLARAGYPEIFHGNESVVFAIDRSSTKK